MNTTTPRKAERLAIEDAANLRETVAAIVAVGGTYEQTGTACLVDGSMYSPSTRALAGGNHCYYIEDEGESLERYTEKLDELTDEIATDLDVSIYWEDGALWLQRAEDTSEDHSTDHGYETCPDCGNVGVKVGKAGYENCTRFLTCWADPS